MTVLSGLCELCRPKRGFAFVLVLHILPSMLPLFVSNWLAMRTGIAS